MKLIACLALAASAVPFAGAQTLTVDQLTQSQLIEKARDLNEKVQGPNGRAAS